MTRLAHRTSHQVLVKGAEVTLYISLWFFRFKVRGLGFLSVLS